jgi:hypothetical protein
MKKPLLQGKLTAISVAILTAAQSPEIIGQVISIPQTFQAAANGPLGVVSLVAAAGVIWGGLRRAFSYFGKGR